MRIVVAIPEKHVTKPVLDGALEAVTRLNEQMIAKGDTPTSRQLIKAGAIWKPEKPGAEHFDHGALIAKRGHGDCDDWAPLHAATLRATGEDPAARAIVKRSGEKRWHAVVKRSDGSIDDPSLAAGMPGRGRGVGVVGAYLPVMRERTEAVVGGAFIASPQLAMRPIADRNGQVEAWQARADLPWHWQPGNSPADVAMVSLHSSPVADQAIVGAARGAFELGLASGYADPAQLRRMSAIADGCEGCGWEELAERYGVEEANAVAGLIDGWFGKKLFRKIKKGAKGLARTALKVAPAALSFVPGGGLATTALKMASPLLQKSVARKKHLPPQVRQQALAQEAAARPAPGQWRTPPGGGMPQFLPYPYPLPYPMPGWPQPGPSTARRRRSRSVPRRAPGTAWPR